MNQLKYILITILLVCNIAKAQISPATKVYLLTLGPGDELYSGFGHSAIWFVDSAAVLDKAYNYGTFDFKPDFYIKFTKGILDYKLSAHQFFFLMEDAQSEQRYLVAQELRLSQSSKKRLFDFLENNLKPENAYYRYDFFYDNCSSRIRDVFQSVLGDSLRYNFGKDQNLSFRQLIDLYLHDKRFQDFGMDLGLGAPADKKATTAQYLFLPEFLKTAFDSAQVSTPNGWQPLVVAQTNLYQPTLLRDKEPRNYTLWFCWALCILVVIFTYQYMNKAFAGHWFDGIWFSLTGLLGCLLLFLWFFTDHNTTQYNYDLLWAMPPNILAAIFLFQRKNNRFLKIYLPLLMACTLTLLFAWKYLPEELNSAVFPLVIINLWRLMKLIFDRFEIFPKN
jgi:hypothetical protein